MKSVLTFLFLAMMVSEPFAQTYKDHQIVFASIASGAITPSKPFTLGIHLKMEQGWHTYWKNPGDAGLPLSAEILDAPNLSAGALRFPTPHKIGTSDIVTYGYEEEVVYTLPVRLLSGIVPKHFRIKLNWLVCKDVCLPAATTLDFYLDSLTSDRVKDDQKLLDRWTARLPQPGSGFNLDKAAATYTFNKDGSIQVFAKFFEIVSGIITDFFPDASDDFTIDLASIKVTDEGISMSMTPNKPGTVPTHLSGIVMIGTSGYEVDIPAAKQ